MATLHITELVKGTAHEVHLCDECAQPYLANPQTIDSVESAAALIKAPPGLGDEELDELASAVCPTCNQTFREFRSQGRLGCANCYTAFRKGLMPLLENIHGKTHHCGKFPKHVPDDSQKRYQLLKLRNDLRVAVTEESYEEAARLRDQIQELERRMSNE
jgi:protein arginine kinase activator